MAEKRDLFPADEARKMSAEGLDATKMNYRYSICNMIEVATERGENECKMHGQLSEELAKELGSLGYKVEQVMEDTGDAAIKRQSLSFTKISW